MACDCENIVNKCVLVNPCSAGTSLGIQAEFTGDYTIQVEFNAVKRVFSVSATEGQQISVPTSVLNENYVHNVVITDPESNEACYAISTSIGLGVANFPVTPAENDTWQWGTLEDLSGNDVISELLEGELAPIIWVNGQPIEWAGQGITHSAVSGTLNFVSVDGISGRLDFQYKNLP